MSIYYKVSTCSIADKNPGQEEEASKKFQEVAEAYEVSQTPYLRTFRLHVYTSKSRADKGKIQ